LLLNLIPILLRVIPHLDFKFNIIDKKGKQKAIEILSINEDEIDKTDIQLQMTREISLLDIHYDGYNNPLKDGVYASSSTDPFPLLNSEFLKSGSNSARYEFLNFIS
jgi:hypothetical protein